MNIFVVGLNHKAAPVEMRERLAFGPSNLPEALSQLAEEFSESVILSTCNRTEIYALANDCNDGYCAVGRFLSSFHDLEESDFVDYLYRHSNENAVRHLFSVASGTDSMIIGEPQILGQVRDALEQALASQAIDKVLDTLFRQAISVGKRARTETAISQNAASVSYAAVELARKIFGELNSRTVLVVGAGEMSKLTARTLLDCGAKGVIVTSRTLARAEQVAALFGGRAIEFERLNDALHDADIVISSTGAPHPIIRPDVLRPVMKARRNRPIFLIDIAVPRDIDPEVQRLDNVFLYDIDDLQGVIESNQRERLKEAEKVKVIIEDEVVKFSAWFNTLDVVPVIVALRQRAETIRKGELTRATAALGQLSEEQQKALDLLTSAIVNKILHEPTVRLKKHASNRLGHHYIETLRDLFGLNEDTVERKP